MLDPWPLEGQDPISDGGWNEQRSQTHLARSSLGAAVGVALGILVSVTTDVPFAPEIGLLLGGLAGWFSAAGVRR